MENHKRHSLGYRAFIIFFLRKIKLLMLLLVLVGSVGYAVPLLWGNYALWADYALKVLLLISGAYLIVLLVRTWLEYRYYTYTFTENALMMNRGYIVREEVATLYHQIQNVNIRRRPLDRMTGVSQIVILMSGGEREGHPNHLILPALSRKKAALVQKELLARAHKNHTPSGSQSDVRTRGH